MSRSAGPGREVAAPAPVPDTAVQDAVRMVTTSREAIPAAADRRAAAVAAARHAIEAALATERAERDAARSALRAGLGRLTAAGLDRTDITGLCGSLPPVDATEPDAGSESPLLERAVTPGPPLRARWTHCRGQLPGSDTHRIGRSRRSPMPRVAHAER